MNRGERVGNLTVSAVAVRRVEHRSPREDRHCDGGLTEPGSIGVDCNGSRCSQAVSEGDVRGKPFTLDHRARGISLEDQTVVVDRDDVSACAEAAASRRSTAVGTLRRRHPQATEPLGRGT